MWSYRAGWENSISTLCSTTKGDASTAYRFNLCSHTGTYIETRHHKLPDAAPLDHRRLEEFVRPCFVICIPSVEARQELHYVDIADRVETLSVGEGDALILATGWGKRHKEKTYLSDCPFFSRELNKQLSGLKLGLLGVDIPIIDDQSQPYGAIRDLFLSSH